MRELLWPRRGDPRFDSASRSCSVAGIAASRDDVEDKLRCGRHGPYVRQRSDNVAMARGGPVGSATALAAAVRYVMAMPPAIRACATIAVGHEAGTENT